MNVNRPIRVLHLVTAMNRGGLETMIMNYYRSINRERVQFDFLVHKDVEGAYDQEIRQLGGRIFSAPPISSRNILRYKSRLSKLIDENPEIRIFHSHLNAVSGIPLFWAAREGIPVRIAHAHNTQIQKARSAPAQKFLKKITPFVATDLFACSHKAGKFMFGERASYRVVRNAIDPETFAFQPRSREKIRNEFGFSDKDLVIGNVGNLRLQKNHIFLVKIFQNLLRKRPNSKLIIVGRDGGEMKSITEYVQKNNLTRDVVLAGPRSDINEVLQALDVFVMPSLHEGLPVVSIEAQAAGLPCVFSDSVTEELALSERCKFVNLEDTLDKWSETILNVCPLDTDDFQSRMGVAPLEDSGYDVRVEAMELMSYYEKTIASDLI